jgi:hypothetical protein
LALGALVWACERHWYSGALAAISLWIVVGLGAQVHDLRASCPPSAALPSEERWGWRFALAWRVAVAALIGACFVIQSLIVRRILVINYGYGDNFLISAQMLCQATLLTAIVLAVASSPRFARRSGPQPWPWVLDLFRCVAAVLLALVVATDHTLITVLVHITIAGIGMAQPPRLGGGFASPSPAELAHLFAVATAGVVSVLVACGLLRLLCLYWWRGRGQRVGLGILLAAGLAAMIAIAVRIGSVEIPRISPILASQIALPGLGMSALAAPLVLLVVTAVARRLSEPSPAAFAGNISVAWRRVEGRYYHERRLVIVLLAAATFLPMVPALMDIWGAGFWESTRWRLTAVLTMPEACLPLAIVMLATASVSSRGSEDPVAASIAPSRLAPGLFLASWLAVLVIIVFAAPILATWGFAYWFNGG